MATKWEQADWLENFEQYNALIKECAGLADVLNLDGEARKAIREQFAVGEPQRFQPVDWDAVKAYLEAEIAKLPRVCSYCGTAYEDASVTFCEHDGYPHPLMTQADLKAEAEREARMEAARNDPTSPHFRAGHGADETYRDLD